MFNSPDVAVALKSTGNNGSAYSVSNNGNLNKAAYTPDQDELIRREILSQCDGYFLHCYNEGRLFTTHAVTVSPEMARRILVIFNLNNRKVKQSNVDVLARIMQDGMWYEDSGVVHIIIGSGEFVIRGEENGDGTTQNGQHTLLAIIKVGVPQKLSFSINSNSNHREPIDYVASRGNITVCENKGYAKHVTQVITGLLRDVLYLQDMQKVAYTQIDGVYDLFKAEVDWIIGITRNESVCPIPVLRKSPARTMFLAILLMNREAGRTFIEQVVKEGLAQNGSPTARLRADFQDWKQGGGITVIRSVARVTFNAWSKWVGGKKVLALKGKEVDYPAIRSLIISQNPDLKRFV